MITAQHIYIAKKAIFTLLAIMLAAYVFVILLTYSPNDPSWSHISSDMGDISNMGGTLGAWIADILYTFLGWSVWWIIIFFAYEALCIWWQRETTHGMMRVIGYVFLLLASGGFIAIVPHLLAADTNAVHHGGILGFEVSRHLAGLLSQVGAAVFLFLFALITATFAFDIHWITCLKNLFSLSWLGSGIKDDSDYQYTDSQDADSQEGAESEAGYGVNSGGYDDDYEDNDNQATSPIFGQLPLNLPDPAEQSVTAGTYYDDDESASQHEHQPTPESSNLLDDFLVSSGISESILSLQQQETLQQEALQQEAHQETDQKTNQAHSQNPEKPNPLAQHIAQHKPLGKNEHPVKQEPSFAWNDQRVIDELLDEQSPQQEQQTAVNTNFVNDNDGGYDDKGRSIDSHPLQDLPEDIQKDDPEDIAKDQEVSTSATSTQISTPQQPVRTHQLFRFGNQSSNAESSVRVDSETMQATGSESLSPETSSSDALTDSFHHLQSGYADSTSEHDLTDYAMQMTDANANANVYADDESSFDNSSSIDLTPTNTPPADPTQPPTAIGEQPNKPSQPVMPKIRFATPEGDSSNHIEDMVPEDDGVDAQGGVSLPDIHDDVAYLTKSRAMQTAKYRDSLTSIPELSLLDTPDPNRKPSYNQEELRQLSELLEIKLQDFNVKAEVVNAIPGPVVTRFEVELAPGVKASKVTGISRDLARSLSMASLRVVEVIPGKPYIGIEVPNKKREMVRLIELLTTDKYKDPKAQISMAMGKDIGGKPIITDLARAPHMLVAGTTGSGKSVLVNSMLLSMLLKYKPDDLRLILIDPKQLELANYNDIPHLLTPVVTDMNEAASSLSWCVAEMERRYQLMSLLKVRKLGEFNKKVLAAEKSGRPIIDPLWRPNDSVSMDKAPKLKTLPMIVIVADEFADMIMQVGKQAEELITRLAQKSRAAGIHLMLATQRPSVDVITGLIKANIPVRAALRVNSKVDSRTILDAGGAEDMLGNGDMLFLGPGQIEPDRVHGAYVSDEEVNRVCDAWRERGAPDYIDNMASNFELSSPSSGGNTSGEDDDLYDQAVAFVMETRKVSASSIQRKFSIGYNRAARIVDSMEEAGLVSSMGKSGKRELLM